MTRSAKSWTWSSTAIFTSALIWEALVVIPPRQSAVVVLHFYRDLSAKDGKAAPIGI